MSRQLQEKQEQKQIRRQEELFKALDFGLPGTLESIGIQLVGLAIKYEDFSCLLTIKAIIGRERSVAFIGSDSIPNCILKAYSEARNETLRWRPDKYHTSDT